VLPRNKQLKLHEAIALVRYHYNRWNSSPDCWDGRREKAHWRLLLQMRSMLARYGIEGFGSPSNDLGIVVFGHDRVIPVGLVSPDEIDAATLQRAREAEGDDRFEQWLSSCRSPEFRELATRAAASAGRNQSASMPRSARD
jgi:hypothetical protein